MRVYVYGQEDGVLGCSDCVCVSNQRFILVTSTSLACFAYNIIHSVGSSRPLHTSSARCIQLGSPRTLRQSQYRGLGLSSSGGSRLILS